MCVLKNIKKLKNNNSKENFVIEVLNNIEQIKHLLEINNYSLDNYKYDVEIYMVKKNENFSKIKKLDDIKEYAIIKDENGNRKMILKNDDFNEVKIYSIYFSIELLYNLGFYELFFLNKDIYLYKAKDILEIEKFEILDIKDEGCFLKIDNTTLDDLKNVINSLKSIGFKINSNNVKVDYRQQKLNKFLFKRK